MIFTVLCFSVCFVTVSSPPVKDRRCHCICPSPLAVLNSSPSNEEKNERRVFTSYVSSNKCNCYDVVLPRIGKEVKERAHELCLLCECKYETRNTIAIMVVVTLLLWIVILFIMYLVFSIGLDLFLKKKFIKKYIEIYGLNGVRRGPESTQNK